LDTGRATKEKRSRPDNSGWFFYAREAASETSSMYRQGKNKLA